MVILVNSRYYNKFIKMNNRTFSYGEPNFSDLYSFSHDYQLFENLGESFIFIQQHAEFNNNEEFIPYLRYSRLNFILDWAILFSSILLLLQDDTAKSIINWSFFALVLTSIKIWLQLGIYVYENQGLFTLRAYYVRFYLSG